MTRITKSAEERRQEIIDISKKLFSENGFDKTQVADISKEMGVAQGLVYHYFKSKMEILYVVIDEISGENEETTRQIISEYHGSAFDCLNMIFMKLINKEKLDKYSTLFSSLKEDHGVMEYVSKRMSMSMESFSISLIERGNADGSWNCEYPKETARFILQGLNGFIGSYPLNQDVNQKKQVLNSIVLRALGVHSPKDR
ncbi:TetR/AcrR family transcriptional regulator [Clostridium akagii]|uniref:TetR/AcrR family transcriptional regulator n=1 Tax=Clostridium akagii TaxID=91623 RepID=UPI00069144A9|nr:TetR/AcrR family transcriptional regulator [Clostridium akagii]